MAGPNDERLEPFGALSPDISGLRCDLHYLPHRFGPAPARNFTIRRESLISSLTEASLGRQLSILHGPAGSGKTCLLAQWADQLRQMGRFPLWLTLESSDGDPASLTLGIAEACIQAKMEPLGKAIHAVLPVLAVTSEDQAARTLAAQINRYATHQVLILDGYEIADTSVLGRFTAALAQHCTGLHIAIASRRRPCLPLGSLRANNQLFELTPPQLNFTHEETAAVLDLVLPELYAHRLHSITDGAPVAVQFARRALDEMTFGVAATRWLDWLNEYYTSELLDYFSLDEREVVGRLMVADRFDLSLAQAIAGPLAGHVVEKLNRVEGILLRDRYGGEFHFPELLRRFLADRLFGKDEREQAALHARAADWFADRGLESEALYHATAAGDRDRSLALLERVGGNSVVLTRGVLGARDLLNAMDLGGFDADPIAHLSFAMLLAHEGKLGEARAIVETARSFIAEHKDQCHPNVPRQLVLIDAFLAGFADEAPDANREAQVRSMLDETAPAEHDDRAQAYTILSWQNYQRGHLDLAEEQIAAAMNEYSGSEGEYGLLFTHIHRILIRFWRNDLEGALHDSTLAVKLARLFYPEDQRLHVVTEILHGAMLLETGPLDRTIEPVNLLGIASGIEAWLEIQIWAHQFAVRSALHIGRLAEARAICANASEVAERLGAPRLEWSLRCLRAHFEMTHGDPNLAQQEAAAIGLQDGSFLNRPGMGWQERIGGLITASKLCAADDSGRAHQLLDAARCELERTPVPRLQAMLHLAEADLCADGERAAAKEHLRRARACFPKLSSARLFGDLPANLRPVAAGHSDPVPAMRQPDFGQKNPLTSREREVLEFIEEGHPNKIAAYRLGLSEATIKFHLRNIYRKLRVQNRTQALARYRRLSNTAK